MYLSYQLSSELIFLVDMLCKTSVSSDGIAYQSYDYRKVGSQSSLRVTLRINVSPKMTIIRYGIPYERALRLLQDYNKGWFVIIEPYSPEHVSKIFD